MGKATDQDGPAALDKKDPNYDSASRRRTAAAASSPWARLPTRMGPRPWTRRTRTTTRRAEEGRRRRQVHHGQGYRPGWARGPGQEGPELRLGEPKKDGGGGKFTMGKATDQDGPAALDK